MTNQIAIQKTNENNKFQIVEIKNGEAVLKKDDKCKTIKVASLKKGYKIITVEPKKVVDPQNVTYVDSLIKAMEDIIKSNDLPKQNKKWHAGLLYANGYNLQQIAKFFEVTAPQIRVYLVYLGLYEPGFGTAQYKKYLDGQNRFAHYFNK